MSPEEVACGLAGAVLRKAKGVPHYDPVLGVDGELKPRRVKVNGQSYVLPTRLWTCSECGAFVSSRPLHSDWHTRIDGDRRV